MNIKEYIGKKIFYFFYWNFNYDRVAERKIKKCIATWHKGGLLNEQKANLMWNSLRKRYSTDFHPKITIGKNLRIEHCMGTMIGETAILGDNVRIYQHVQVIAKVLGDQALIDKKNRRHAKIGNNVILGAGCCIIGPITIGDNCIIGAYSVVTHDVPENSIVTGVNMIRKRPDGIEAPKFITNAKSKF